MGAFEHGCEMPNPYNPAFNVQQQLREYTVALSKIQSKLEELQCEVQKNKQVTMQQVKEIFCNFGQYEQRAYLTDQRRLSPSGNFTGKIQNVDSYAVISKLINDGQSINDIMYWIYNQFFLIIDGATFDLYWQPNKITYDMGYFSNVPEIPELDIPCAPPGWYPQQKPGKPLPPPCGCRDFPPMVEGTEVKEEKCGCNKPKPFDWMHYN